MGTVFLNRVSGSTLLKLRVDYVVTPQIGSRNWHIYAELRAQKDDTTTAPTEGNSGYFKLSLNGSPVEVTKAYSFYKDDQLILAHSVIAPETPNGAGQWRLETYYKGYNIEGNYYGNIDLPQIDVSSPAISAWVSNITSSGAVFNASASHCSYNLTSISWYLDDTLQDTEQINNTFAERSYAISGLEAGSTHTARVVVTAENGRSSEDSITFESEYLPIQSISFDDMTVEVNRVVKIPVTITPEKVSEIPRYSIADTSIASVDSEGYVTALRLGSTKVSVISDNINETRSLTVVAQSEVRYNGRSVVRVFDVYERDFVSGGLGTLMPTVCTVKEAINGEYSLHIEHTRDRHGKYKRIKKEAVIECPTPRGYDLFRIITVTENTPGIISAEAQHITYDAADNIVLGRSFSGAGGDAAVSLNSYEMNGNDIISITSDIRQKADWTYETKNPIELMLGTDDNGFIKVYGGEAWRYRLLFEMRTRIGRNDAFNIAYRKNLKGVTLTEDDSDVVTVIIPSANISGGGIAINRDWAVMAENMNDYPNPKIRNVHFSDVTVSAVPTADEINLLKERAINKFSDGISYPAVTLSVNIIALETTAEFSNFKSLLTLHIGDRGVCRLQDGRVFNLRMMEYEYDVLRRRYTNVILGTQKATLIDYINKLGE